MNLFNLTRGFGFRQTMLLTAGCFVLIALGVTGVTIVSRQYTRQGTRQTQTLTEEFLPGLVTLAQLQDATLNLKSITFQFALAKDEEAMREQKQAFQLTTIQVTRSIAKLKRLAQDDPTLLLIDAFAADVQSYRVDVEQFQAELGAGEFEKAMATLDHEVAPAQEEIETHLGTLSEQYFELSHNAGARTTEVLEQSEHFGLLATIVLAGFTLLCLALSLAATRALLGQVQKREAERQTSQDTLEKRVEERTAALAASKERIRLIVDTASDAIISVDAGGAITAWNHQAQNTFGWTQAEALGRNFAETLIAPHHRAAHREQLEHFFSSGDGAALIQRQEISVLHRDGHELPAELAISPIRLGETVLFSVFLHDITERKRDAAELENVYKQLLETSRQAGMAEVATSVLHNVGNVLNSVNISAGMIIESVKKSRGSSLTRVVVLLEEHAHDLGDFVTNDSRGKHVVGHLAKISEHLLADQATIVRELDSLQRNVEHIKEIVAMQQNYATVGGVKETINMVDLVEESIRMNEQGFGRHRLKVIREFEQVPPLSVEKHKILQILVNLLRNAKHACQDSEGADKRMTVRITNGDHRIKISISDNGIGIPPENLTRIFNHGFTTRKDGHGFGLHSGALAAKEVGGSLIAHSDGPGQGATFTLELPCPTQENSHD
jgi:PAS domain S-box-containing protein